MHGTIVPYGLLGLLAIALATAAVTDCRRREIDNVLNAAIAITAPLFWWSWGMSLADIGWQVVLAGVVLVVLAGLFALRAMGGGDVKLLVALALWIRPIPFLHLLMVMALAGGVLTVALAVWHIARRQRDRMSVPYGIAIALGGLWTLAVDYVPALPDHMHG